MTALLVIRASLVYEVGSRSREQRGNAMQRKPDAEGAVYEEPSTLEELAAMAPDPSASPGPTAMAALVGDCIDATHPTLTGRALIRWTGPTGPRELWLAALHGLAVRRGDRVLISQPANWPEPIVTGVIDGFARRPELPRSPGPTIALQKDESVRVTGIDGEPLCEIHASDRGPVVRLLAADVNLVLPGELRVDAKAIALVAREGEVRLEASDDVVVKGEMVKLN
jgi:hypothetical protein